MRKLVVAIIVVSGMVFASNAGAAIPKVFDGKGDIECTVKGPGSYEGQRWCGSNVSSSISRSTATTFDNVPIDVNVAFPASGDGPYPLMMIFHGYAGNKVSFDGMQRWLDRGYAVFSMTDRGFHESCGSPASRLIAGAACDKGYLRLLDTRYEVRDAQVFAGLLADEGRIIPDRIAATGGSYGGGLSMALAALKNRTMMPNDKLVPWKSPDGKAMELAVAIPSIPWTDLAYSLVPNGNTLDYVKDNSYYGRFGVMKESWVNLLYTLGLAVGEANYALPGEDDSADLTGWKSLLDAGEPYDGRPEADAILDDIKTHHSSYYIDHSIAPAPIHISSGFTDDLFPVDEAIRFYNRTRGQYPGNPIGLFLNPNSGHMRGMSKPDVTEAQQAIENSWVDYYLKDAGSKPAANVTAYLQTCPEDASAGSPYVAKDWASIAPGEIRLVEPGSKTVGADSGDPLVGGLFNPAPAGKACTAAPGAEELGTANYELPAAPAGGYTILGSPTVVAAIEQAGTTSQIAARLVDVSSDGLSKVLIARGLWRPTPSGKQVFQLHANGYKVEEGHVARLELLAKDASVPAGGEANYGRPSNDQTEATITDMDLRVPVADQPGSLGGLVTEPMPKVLPDRPGVALAPGYEAIGSVPIRRANKRLIAVGKLTAKGRKLKIRLRCPKDARSCPKTTVTVKKGKSVIASRKGVKVGKGKTKTVALNLTTKARKLMSKKGRNLKRFKAKVTIGTNGLKKLTVVRTVKRIGNVR
jgi:hypothetical protein